MSVLHPNNITESSLGFYPGASCRHVRVDTQSRMVDEYIRLCTYETPWYPCGCGGRYEPDGMHVIGGSCGESPSWCCEMWRCQDCKHVEYQCQDWNRP